MHSASFFEPRVGSLLCGFVSLCAHFTFSVRRYAAAVLSFWSSSKMIMAKLAVMPATKLCYPKCAGYITRGGPDNTWGGAMFFSLRKLFFYAPNQKQTFFPLRQRNKQIPPPREPHISASFINKFLFFKLG